MSDEKLLAVVADLEDRLEDMKMDFEERIDELEEEVEEERERADRLEDQLADERDRRYRLEVAVAKFDRDQENGHRALKIKTDAMYDRIASLEDEAVNAEDVIHAETSEALLPIQQLYNTVKNGGEDSMNANQARAAKIWPHFRDYADPSGGALTLTSPKVRDILDRELGIEQPNANTVKRVMQFLERFSGRDEDSRIIRLDTSQKTNRLECDRDDWLEATGEMMDAARKNGAERAVTDGGENGGA